jgi:hypothetical protein
VKWWTTAARYETLKAFYEAHAMKAEAEWVAKRLRECRGTAGGDEKPAEPSTGKGSSPAPNSAAGEPGGGPPASRPEKIVETGGPLR